MQRRIRGVGKHGADQLFNHIGIDRLDQMVIESGLHPYDIQGPMAVIRAAGGMVTDWTGGTAAQGGRVLAAANADIHAAAMALLAP